MSWNDQMQKDAEKTRMDYTTEFSDKLGAWINAVKSGVEGNGLAAVEDVLRRWRQSVAQLQSQSDVILSNDNIMEELSTLASQVASEKATLAKLKGEAVTRTDQADSVNPKIRGSPYTNILGLQRQFRSSTRFAILIASIVFGVLALCVLGFLVYRVVQTGSLSPTGYAQAGGNGLTNLRGNR